MKLDEIVSELRHGRSLFNWVATIRFLFGWYGGSRKSRQGSLEKAAVNPTRTSWFICICVVQNLISFHGTPVRQNSYFQRRWDSWLVMKKCLAAVISGNSITERDKQRRANTTSIKIISCTVNTYNLFHDNLNNRFVKSLTTLSLMFHLSKLSKHFCITDWNQTK